jgi:hypothetical protein
MKLLGIISVGFDITEELLTGESTGEKMGVTLDSRSVIHRFQESARLSRAILYNILIGV